MIRFILFVWGLSSCVDGPLDARAKRRILTSGSIAIMCSALSTRLHGDCPDLTQSLRQNFLDWFHLAMRFQHATLAASALSADNARRVQAKAMIVEKVERLRWRIWNGQGQEC